MSTTEDDKARAVKARAAKARAAKAAKVKAAKAETTVIDEHGDAIDSDYTDAELDAYVADEADEPDEPGTEVAEVEPWDHETIEYADEVWEVRTPTEQALTGVALSSGKYIPQQLQNDVIGLFIRNHTSPATFTRMYERMMDPGDDEFGPTALGEIMRQIAMLATK